MNTLTSPTLAALLTKLFADAHASDAQMEKDMSGQSPEDVARRASTTDYLAFYRRAKDYHLAVSPGTGRLLYMLARSSGARAIVEFGTSFGISTLHLAAALKDNGGGRLIGSEFEPSKAAQARGNLTAAGLSDLVDIREGDALESLSRELPPSIDLVLLDGAKSLYLKVLGLLEPHLRAGALIVADNAIGALTTLRACGPTTVVSCPCHSATRWNCPCGLTPDTWTAGRPGRARRQLHAIRSSTSRRIRRVNSLRSFLLQSLRTCSASC